MGEGKQLKLLLKEKGFTVKRFAKSIDLPPTTLYSMISRDSHVNRELLSRMAEVLNMDPFDLLCRLNLDEISECIPDEAMEDISDPFEGESEEDIATSIQCLTKEEFDLNLKALKSIHKSLNKLNPIGTNEAAKRVEELTHIDKYKRSPLVFSSIAAHERTDIEVTDEMREHDMKIIEDEDF